MSLFQNHSFSLDNGCLVFQVTGEIQFWALFGAFKDSFVIKKLSRYALSVVINKLK